jgi:hypothetical protein
LLPQLVALHRAPKPAISIHKLTSSSAINQEFQQYIIFFHLPPTPPAPSLAGPPLRRSSHLAALLRQAQLLWPLSLPQHLQLQGSQSQFDHHHLTAAPTSSRHHHLTHLCAPSHLAGPPLHSHLGFPSTATTTPQLQLLPPFHRAIHLRRSQTTTQTPTRLRSDLRAQPPNPATLLQSIPPRPAPAFSISALIPSSFMPHSSLLAAVDNILNLPSYFLFLYFYSLINC